MNYSRFGGICELDSEQAVAPLRGHTETAAQFASKESRFAHSDVRKSSINVLFIIHERATNVCILYVWITYLNNVLGCCRAYTL